MMTGSESTLSCAETTPEARPARDVACWARPVLTFQVTEVPVGAVNLNVDGRQAIGPLQGFGQMWRKLYRVRLSGAHITPAEVIAIWKQEFGTFWPPINRFYPSLTGIQPGELAFLNLAAPVGLRLSTGIRVIFADDTSFTFADPQGHMFAAWITFSAFEEEGATVAQVEALLRASDPIFELSMRLGIGGQLEDSHWRYTLRTLAHRFGVDGHVQQIAILVDPRVQWTQAKNIWYNAGIRTVLYTLTTPVRWSWQQIQKIVREI